ncbi:hypothetical protein [Micromonospora avicenniae]|uniref:Helix-turn-helix domain-containing protein n=1 Tax=Micromonospora avicenniae TaxID=1198245 RepID=A0A1N6YEK1_9ACTN|nr:hypothetical protein [Micromonospora avicenniae]SIR12988.1 hypothetical protein SAMN05444858_106276 [Micromonospora avicenniae]
MRTKPRTKRGTGRGKGPLVLSVRRSSHARIVLVHMLADAGMVRADGLIDYHPLRGAMRRSGVSQAEFERELGRLADEGHLSVEHYRTPDGLLLNRYRLATELRIKQ